MVQNGSEPAVRGRFGRLRTCGREGRSEVDRRSGSGAPLGSPPIAAFFLIVLVLMLVWMYLPIKTQRGRNGG